MVLALLLVRLTASSSAGFARVWLKRITEGTNETLHVEGLRRGFMKRIDELVMAEGGRLPHY